MVVAPVLVGLVVTGYFDRVSIAAMFTTVDFFYTAMGPGLIPRLSAC